MSFQFNPSSSSNTGQFSFGTQQQQPQQQQQQQQPQFSFGAPSTANSTNNTFSFGANTGSSAPQFSFGGGSTDNSSGFSFGSGTSNNNASSGFSFGNTATGNTGGFSFGNTATGNTGGFSFGNTATNTGGGGFSFGFGAQSQQQQQQNVIAQKLVALRNAYHPQSPTCRFQVILYRVIHRELPPPQRPAWVSERLWQQALRNNPHPDRWTLDPLVGFASLQKRIQTQEQAAARQEEALVEIQKDLFEMERRHEELTKVVIAELRARHAELAHRVLQVMSKLQVLQTKDLPLVSEEVTWKKELNAIQRELVKPQQFQARVRELASMVRTHDGHQSAGVALDPENLARIKEFLLTQKRGLEHLTQLVRDDLHACDVITKK